MISLINAALNRSRTVVLVLLLILISGALSFSQIAKENNPDITLPNILVTMSLEGVSPEDADRLLVRPTERELRSLDGLREITSTSRQGRAQVFLEFDPEIDINEALQEARQRVDAAKAEYPDDADEPSVREINLALFPVITVTLSGPVEERVLATISESLKDRLENIPGVLEAEIQGKREEVADVIIQPTLMDSYNISQRNLFQLVNNNNQLVAAGTLDNGQGRFPIKVPGLFEDAEDILTMPVKTNGQEVVTFQDIASVSMGYKDPTSFARVNQQRTVTLEVSKRIGANIIATIDQIKVVVNEAQRQWNFPISVSFTQDQSKEIANSLNDLYNNVVTATLLVMIVIIATLGIRSAILVGIAIPGSFLAGILFLDSLGYTLNNVVLFGLILSVGMLVDGAIVVTEYADRKMAEGFDRKEAYRQAAIRMAWPIIASNATTLAVFMPLLFWPGIVGEFMKYLPITVLFTLASSLFMALIIVPTLGSLFGKPGSYGPDTLKNMKSAETGDVLQLKGLTGIYVQLLNGLFKFPGLVLLVALSLVISIYALYGYKGKGVEFFPSGDASTALVFVRARGDLALLERDALVKQVEQRISGLSEIELMYTTTVARAPRETPVDTVGVIQVELIPWYQRRPAKVIMEDIRQLTKDFAGIVIETRVRNDGPGDGADIQIEVSSEFQQPLIETVSLLRKTLEQTPQIRDVQDTRTLPGIEWQINVNREEASRYGVDIALVGTAVQLVTNGLKIGEFRPDFADDEVDIRVRFPRKDRGLDQLDNLMIPINEQLVPVANFIKREPAQKLGSVKRTDGKLSYVVEAYVEPGVLVDNKVKQIAERFNQLDLPRDLVSYQFRGNTEDQAESQAFLLQAFIIALFVMAIILVTQFNRFYQALLILTAVMFSTAGVLLALLYTGQPFGIVMSGVGVIALAGIVVNNNIVLIDTYNQLRQGGQNAVEAALRTGAQRLRPVMLTTITTVLGLLPMVYQANIDLINREITIGAPSSLFWTQLATTIVGGLMFATLLTLIVTPSLLVLGDNVSAFFKRPKQLRQPPPMHLQQQNHLA